MRRMPTMQRFSTFFLAPLGLMAALAVGCSASSDSSTTTPDAAIESSTDAPATQTLCVQYGGYDTVKAVVDHAVAAVAADCRINTFFTSLTPAKLTHVVECLKIQIGNVMACDGVRYAGATDSSGVACRSMADAHKGLAISDGDFKAFVETVAGSLAADKVAAADIATLGVALNGTHDDVVDATKRTDPAHGKSICAADAGTHD